MGRPALRVAKSQGALTRTDGSWAERNDTGDRMAEAHGRLSLSATNGAARFSSPAIIRSNSEAAASRSW